MLQQAILRVSGESYLSHFSTYKPILIFSKPVGNNPTKVYIFRKVHIPTFQKYKLLDSQSHTLPNLTPLKSEFQVEYQT